MNCYEVDIVSFTYICVLILVHSPCPVVRLYLRHLSLVCFIDYVYWHTIVFGAEAPSPDAASLVHTLP